MSLFPKSVPLRTVDWKFFWGTKHGSSMRHRCKITHLELLFLLTLFTYFYAALSSWRLVGNVADSVTKVLVVWSIPAAFALLVLLFRSIFLLLCLNLGVFSWCQRGVYRPPRFPAIGFAMNLEIYKPQKHKWGKISTLRFLIIPLGSHQPIMLSRK